MRFTITLSASSSVEVGDARIPLGIWDHFATDEYAEENGNGESYTDANAICTHHRGGVIIVKAAKCSDLNQPVS